MKIGFWIETFPGKCEKKRDIPPHFLVRLPKQASWTGFWTDCAKGSTQFPTQEVEPVGHGEGHKENQEEEDDDVENINVNVNLNVNGNNDVSEAE